MAAGATVGTLSATDGIGNISYSLVPGEDDDSDSFVIEGNEVKVASAALTAGTYNFRVKGEDEGMMRKVASPSQCWKNWNSHGWFGPPPECCRL